MTRWKINDLIISLCGSRLKGYNWLNKATIGLQCSDGEKKCGDDPDTFFCVQSDSPCPLTHVAMDERFDIAYEKPIVEFRIGTDRVCMQNNITRLSEGRVEYPLMKTKR
jgi:hypothetical protein